MVRRQIQLAERAAASRKLAADGTESIARLARATRAVGKFASNSPDGSRLHDKHLADAFDAK
jgi:hypothetical protein